MITDDLENELRSAFSRSAADIFIPEQARQRLLQRDYHPKTGNRRLAAGLAAAAIAAAVTIPLAAGGGSQPAAGPVIRLASHTFRLPAGYKLTAATSPPCHVVAIVSYPARLKGPITENPPPSAQMKAAASASGGCILAMLLPRYTPTTATPDAEAPAIAHPVQVGRYHGWIFHYPFVSVSKTGLKSPLTELGVQLPAGGGKMRDLVIGAKQLSDAALIKIAASGLST